MEINKNTSLFSLAWPIFCQALLAMGIGYVDQLMLAKYSDNAPGAVGNAAQILGFLTLAFTLISSAAGVIIAQYLGAKLKDELNQIYTLSISFNLVLSVIISFIVFYKSNAIFKLMNVPAELLPDANRYLKIVGGFVFLEAVFHTFSQIFRSNGMTKIGMVISLLINFLNIAGNYTFLYGPLKHLDMGVTGVAISSAASKFVAVVVAYFFFVKEVKGRISIKYIVPFPMGMFKKLIKLGIPTAGESISYNISQLVIAAIVNSMGKVAINTKIYAGILCNFAYLYSVSVAIATSIIVGHEIGAGEYDAAYKRVFKTLKPAIVIAEIIAITNLLISKFTLGIFTNNENIIALGQKVMIVAIFLEIGRTCNLVIINSERAAGDVKFPTILGIISMWGVSVTLAFLLGIKCGLGIVGVWIGMAADEIVRGIIVAIRWKNGKWRGKSIVDKVQTE